MLDHETNGLGMKVTVLVHTVGISQDIILNGRLRTMLINY